jgi:hypothetical protein
MRGLLGAYQSQSAAVKNADSLLFVYRIIILSFYLCKSHALLTLPDVTHDAWLSYNL